MRFDLYIFDLDGTLVDTLEIWNDISLAFLARFDIVPTEEEIRAMDAMSFQEGSDYLRVTSAAPKRRGADRSMDGDGNRGI